MRASVKHRWDPFDPSNQYVFQERERLLLALLLREGFGSDRLARSTVLSVGCGTAFELLELVRYGANPARLVGLDLAHDRLTVARARYPSFGFARASATSVPFPARSFDLVLQYTLFTSVLDNQARRRIASEILRILLPSGMVVWYDFWPNNPWNQDVRGIRATEIRSLFPGCTFNFRRLTLLPPLVRWLAPRSWLLANLLSRFPPLLTHYLVAIRPAST